MLTDEAKIKIQSGKGGDGIVAFDKVMMSLGPTGGRGGNGGNIYFEGVSDVFALNKYRHMKEHYAPDGKDGRGNRSDGPNGKDLILTVPVGTLLTNTKNGRTQEITQVGQTILAAKGGIGGRGNFFFRSGSVTSPTKFELGKPGESFELSIELRLIADVGLIGLPSAGKSSLLNELTAARAKVAAYHFTTLEPNLGVMDLPQNKSTDNKSLDKKNKESDEISSEELSSENLCRGGIILADIPGLIEGASAGRGLGIKFLRHIQRTKVLLHCISLESDDLARDYNIIRQELSSYDPKLIEKKELVILTKNDLVDEKELKKRKKELKIKSEIISVSIHSLEDIEALKKKILELLQ